MGTQSATMQPDIHRSYILTSAERTKSFACALAPLLGPGDTILLSGGLGAGKTYFARSLIQARLLGSGLVEDVPSPTFTLAQTYWDGVVEIWHCDLYRLTGPNDVHELGLEDAFDSSICLIEWPDRLATLAPEISLSLTFAMTQDEGVRTLTATASHPRWSKMLDAWDTKDAKS